MKQLPFSLMLLTILICGFAPFSSSAQCSISICEETGAFAYAYNAKNEHYSMAELKKMSLNSCREVGGTRCYNYLENYTVGWWAFIVGRDLQGRFIRSGIMGASSKDKAISTVRLKYIKDGGQNVFKTQVHSWYVNRNNKN